MTITNSSRLSNFNPLPPWGGRHQGTNSNNPDARISIHSLRGEGDSEAAAMYYDRFISIHSLRGEGDYKMRSLVVKIKIFQSTPSVGRETALITIIQVMVPDFNPLPPWGGRPFQILGAFCSRVISIHSLRGEGDGIN